MSLTLAAGIFETMTVMDPFATMPGPPGTQPGNIQGADLHVAVAAGILLIITVGFPSIITRGKPG